MVGTRRLWSPASCQVLHSPITFLSSKDMLSQGLSPENPSAKGGPGGIRFQNEARGESDSDHGDGKWEDRNVSEWRESRINKKAGGYRKGS